VNWRRGKPTGAYGALTTTGLKLQDLQEKGYNVKFRFKKPAKGREFAVG